MSQGPLCPNLTKKVQKEVSQMANRKLSCAMLYRWFKCKLKPPNKKAFQSKASHPLADRITINLCSTSFDLDVHIDLNVTFTLLVPSKHFKVNTLTKYMT